MTDQRALLQRVAATVSLNSANPKYFYCLGCYLQRQGRFAQAMAHFRRAVELQPTHAAAQLALGHLLRDEGRLDEAEACYLAAAEAQPKLEEPHFALARLDEQRGSLRTALEHYDRALALRPMDHEARLLRGMLSLQTGDFEHGWREFEWRWRKQPNPIHRMLPLPIGDGTAPENHALLVRAERHLADNLLFASCLPDLIARARSCWIESAPGLQALLRRSFPRQEIVGPIRSTADLAKTHGWRYGQITAQIMLGSLARYFRSRREAFPTTSGYLRPDPLARLNWRERFEPRNGGLIVGIAWRGQRRPSCGLDRSPAWEDWAPVFQVPGVVFVSLQPGDVSGELARLRDQFGCDVYGGPPICPRDQLDDFAARVAAVDLVIAVPNLAAHLAGALGMPSWTLLCEWPSWRWMLDGPTTPWYPRMRLVRRPAGRAWGDIMRQVAHDLSGVVRQRKVES
jgi:tetratricopeptide (TPR) repeat protein